MWDWDEQWNISLAGCGFRSVYYLGALSCILQQAPQLVHGAAKICGASSGCLVAAALAVGIPIGEFSRYEGSFHQFSRKRCYIKHPWHQIQGLHITLFEGLEIPCITCII